MATYSHLKILLVLYLTISNNVSHCASPKISNTVTKIFCDYCVLFLYFYTLLSYLYSYRIHIVYVSSLCMCDVHVCKHVYIMLVCNKLKNGE